MSPVARASSPCARYCQPFHVNSDGKVRVKPWLDAPGQSKFEIGVQESATQKNVYKLNASRPAQEEMMKGRISKRVWFWSVAVLLVMAVWIGSVLGQYDSHQTNFRYLTWKYGRSPQDYKWCLHLMMVDRNLLDSMEGKTMSQLRQWLPETGPTKAGSWQAEWLSYMKPGPNTTYEQIGDSNLAIELENGRFKMIYPMKG